MNTTAFAEYKRLPADERDRLGFAKWQEEQRGKRALKELAQQQAGQARTAPEPRRTTP